VTPLPAGRVSATANPLVASYSISPGQTATVYVEFGTDTTYGRQTSSQTTVSGAATILVAGMRQNTLYHMRAVVQLANGTTQRDVDHTFTTSAFPSTLALPTLSVATSDNAQSGVELVAADFAPETNFLQAYAVDLQGNLIWDYSYAGQTSAIVQPIKLLSNGHMILIASAASQSVTSATPGASLVTLREIDLAGTTIRELTLSTLNSKLTAAGRNLTLTDCHHDVTALANGHFLLIASTVKEYDNVTGFPGANQVVGDVVLDLDQNFDPVWIWNEFDHLDVNRHPTNFPDWTHTNAVLYSKDDGNILVSMRHQSWIVKVDYEDGAGTGDIIWRLGEGGDFTLTGGTDPTDWFYGQHQPSFISPNTTGVFSMTMMDNGYGRLFPPGVTCGSANAPACDYTRIPMFQMDESAKTAALIYQNTQPLLEYSYWGGGTTWLANGNIEYDLCAVPGPKSIVREIVPGVNPTVAWELDIGGENAYRANRIPSLYPGVQW
jgi:arylsulfate sulfotransferase